jgi:hypothetical protein
MRFVGTRARRNRLRFFPVARACAMSERSSAAGTLLQQDIEHHQQGEVDLGDIETLHGARIVSPGCMTVRPRRAAPR